MLQKLAPKIGTIRRRIPVPVFFVLIASGMKKLALIYGVADDRNPALFIRPSS